MTKSELIAQLVAENPHLRPQHVEAIIATIFEEITAALARGDRVELRGFGAFSVKRRDPRQGRNPRTGESVAVSGKAVPFFKPGKELREIVNGGPPQGGTIGGGATGSGATGSGATGGGALGGKPAGPAAHQRAPKG